MSSSDSINDVSQGGATRGRPRLKIDSRQVADTVAELFREGGEDAVSISEVAERLSVSRATLYRTIPSKEDLLGILFDRSTRELLQDAREMVAQPIGPRDQLDGLIRIQISAAIRMRGHMAVFFGGSGFSTDVVERWRVFTREYEDIWVSAVRANIDSGDLDAPDARIATRLMLGACIWVSRWYKPDGPFDERAIADTAVALLRQYPKTAADLNGRVWTEHSANRSGQDFVDT